MKNILVTSGGTQVKIDDVRHIGNMSSGKFGAEIAEELLKRGDFVTYLGSKDGREPFDLFSKKCLEGGFFSRLFNCAYRIYQRNRYAKRLTVIKYKTYDEYRCNVLYCQPDYDIIILAAAVSDYIVEPISGKMDSHNPQEIKLIPADKVIKSVKTWSPASFVVGFKLVCSTSERIISDEEKHQIAQNSFENNKCDIVVLNDLSDIRKGNHSLNVYHPGASGWLRLSGKNLAKQLTYSI